MLFEYLLNSKAQRHCQQYHPATHHKRCIYKHETTSHLNKTPSIDIRRRLSNFTHLLYVRRNLRSQDDYCLHHFTLRPAPKQYFPHRRVELAH